MPSSYRHFHSNWHQLSPASGRPASMFRKRNAVNHIELILNLTIVPAKRRTDRVQLPVRTDSDEISRNYQPLQIPNYLCGEGGRQQSLRGLGRELICDIEQEDSVDTNKVHLEH